MFKRLSSILLMALLLTAGSAPAWAIRQGISLEVGGGSGDAEWDADVNDWAIDSRSFAIGYVMDSAPEPTQLFNYRLKAGLIWQDLESDDKDRLNLDSTGIFIENIFGFALLRNDDYRWWLGPSVRVGLFSGDDDRHHIDLDYAELAIGVVSGVNIKSGNLILSPSMGLRFSGMLGDGENGPVEDDWSANAGNLFFDLSVLF